MKGAKISVRRLVSEDAALYRDTRLDGLKFSPESFGSTYAFESAQPLAWFAARCAEDGIFGAFQDQELVGVVSFSVQRGQKQAHKGVLWGMYVRRSARSAGVGRRLVEAVIEHAHRHSEIIQLTVASGNTTAIRLYRGLGFVEYGLEKNALKHDDRYFDEMLMAKALR